MPKTYVLDTNVLLHDPRALFVFEEHCVVIPMAVIEEIDNQKRRQDEIGRNARDDLGYLPGTKEEKLRPWMQPIYDNLDFLFRACSDSRHLLDDFLRRGTIEMETLTYMRGRSIPNQFILCDEAQNLSPNMVKTLVTRMGEGSKLVLTGDPEQIDHPYLDADSNGLTYLVEKLKSEKISGHVLLSKGERSKVAELAAKLL